MIRTLALSAMILAGTAAESFAQPPYRYSFPQSQYPYPNPYPESPRFPQRAPRPQFPNRTPNSVDGMWYFRGDPNQPAYIETVRTPFGTQLIVTNEKGSPAQGELSPDGRRLLVYDWNITGRVQGNYLIWPNGDFWSR